VCFLPIGSNYNNNAFYLKECINKENTMRIKMLKVAVAGLVLSVSGFANAGLISFDNRIDFQNYVSSFQLDDLTSVTQGVSSLGQDRGDYSWNMSSYGCQTTGDCGDNSSEGFVTGGYVWTYGDGAFTFDNAINAFGIDYTYRNGTNDRITLNGLASQTSPTGGFFGIVDTTSTFTTVNYTARGSSSLFDNVTYGSESVETVPEPTTLATFALGLMGLAARRFKKQ
jgi:hypothetical protein